MSVTVHTPNPKIPFEKLPYEVDALDPYFSSESFLYHHGRHYKQYVDKLNLLLADSSNLPTFTTLEALLSESSHWPTAVVNQAAQVWNHQFFWQGLRPLAAPQTLGSEQLRPWLHHGGFESEDQLKSTMKQLALTHFGSGWLWVYRDVEGALKVESMPNAETPWQRGGRPIATLDLWEHAYYIDFRNDRAAYFEAFWQLCNWSHWVEKLKENFTLAS